MKFQINQRSGGTLKIKFLLLLFLVLFGCATVPGKTYDEAVSEWKSYKDVANWMISHYSFDAERCKEFLGKPISNLPSPVRTPKETFELKSGLCFDAAHFTKETLNRINPSYEAEIVYIKRENVHQVVCSFKKDSKLYIMDYGSGWKKYHGVHGPYDSLKEYKTFLERNGPPEPWKIFSITFGWPQEWKKYVK